MAIVHPSCERSAPSRTRALYLVTPEPQPSRVFESARLTVQRLGPGDEAVLQTVFEKAGDYFLRVTGHSAPEPDAAAREIGSCIATPGREVALLSLHAEAEPVGVLGWWHGNPEPDVTLLGMLMLVPAQRGQGLARDALAALAAREAQRGIRRLRTAVAAGSYREHALLRALGFAEMPIRDHVALGLSGANLALFEKPVG